MCMGSEDCESAVLCGWTQQGAFSLSITEDGWEGQKNKSRASFCGTTQKKVGSGSSPWVVKSYFVL